MENNHLSRRTLWLLLAGIFLISFSLLAFEIALVRVLSVMLFYHYVFIVVSLALLGLGAGGIFVYLFRPKHSHFGSLAPFASLFSLSIPASVIVITRVAHIDNILLNGLLLFVPFFFAGALMAEVFRMFPSLSSRIYGVDLLGAAAGSIGVVLVLNSLGGINTVLTLGVVASIAAMLFALRIVRRNIIRLLLPALSLMMVVGLLGLNLVGSSLLNVPIGISPVKEIHHVLSAQEGEIIETRWSAFGRTDLVAFRNNPQRMEIYVDGTAGSSMYRFDGNFDNPPPAVNRLKTDFPGYVPLLPLQEEERNNALIIGSGGGRDILLALMGGVDEVTAVEVNKDLVDIVDQYAWYNGGIYTDMENVSVYVDEGRSFLQRQKEKYDIIMLSLPITKTSRSLEGYALTENFLFTTDSIDDYLEHLTDEGRLIVVAHNPYEILKLLSVSLTSLKQRGIDNETAMEQIYLVGSGDYPVFVLKKTPFESTEMVLIHQSIHQFGYEPALSYLPTIRQVSDTSHAEGGNFNECAMLDPLLIAVGRGDVSFDDVDRVLKENGLDVNPATDNSPFFYNLKGGIPRPVVLVLWASLGILLLVSLVPLVRWKRRSSYRKAPSKYRSGFNDGLPRFVVLFSMLGIGFMLVEISAIQRFILFLGQPVLSLATLLFSLLVGAGIGSMYSGRVASGKIVKAIAIVSMSIVTVLLVYAFSLPLILEQLLGLELAIRLLVTFVMLAPLGFLMGFPFPLGLRLLKEQAMEQYIPWMWGINGVSSVLGSAMTIVVAISFGFTEALLLGAGGYLVVFFTFQRVQFKRSLAQKGGGDDIQITNTVKATDSIG